MSGLSDAQFNWLAVPGRWSMAGCFDCLNKSAEWFILKINGAIAAGKAQALKSDGPFTAYSAFERWAIRKNDAPVKQKFKAMRKAQSAPHLSLAQARDEFVRWQDELSKRLRKADGPDLRRAKEVFPFWPLKWSLAALIQMMIAHERPHVWQAWEVRKNPAFPV